MISKGKNVTFARFALLAVSEEAKTFLFRSMYDKTIFRFGLCDIKNNQSLSKGYQPQSSTSADNLKIKRDLPVS